MKKILWLSNLAFSDQNLKTTGGWLQPLAEALRTTFGVEIANVVMTTDVKSVENYVLGSGIRQWLIPWGRNKLTIVAGKEICDEVVAIVKKEKPDLIHIWGTENVWASIYAKGCLKKPVLIDIQGILSSSYYYYYGNLSIRERLCCIGIKEALNPKSSIFADHLKFYLRGKWELKFLKCFRHISVQSNWVEARIRLHAPQANIHHTGLALRDVFYTAKAWEHKEFGEAPIIFSTASGSIPYKGMHVLIKALPIVKKYYPRCQLHIAGNYVKQRKQQGGYTHFILSLIDKLDLKDNVVFLGAIDKLQIVSELKHADLAVIPSFVETYCLALAESLMIGTPTVASYAGAMPEQATDGQEALFYEPTDYISCADRMIRILNNKDLAQKLSQNSRRRKQSDNDIGRLVERQMTIYREVGAW